MSFRINFIRPGILNSSEISSWFTLRNQDLVQKDRKIAGLNLGLNTSEESAVVEQNRKLLLDEIGLKENEIVFGTQIHKTDVKTVHQGGSYENTDAFVTNQRGLALAIQVADCAAVLLGDNENRVIGAAHAGWRGAADGIVPKTIQKMIEIGADVKNIKAFVSPCISLENFEVGDEVAEQFPQQFVNIESFAKPHVDLKAFIKHQLLETGIGISHIEIDEHCTISDDNFYSYRRQKENSGRMMGLIKLNG